MSAQTKATWLGNGNIGSAGLNFQEICQPTVFWNGHLPPQNTKNYDTEAVSFEESDTLGEVFQIEQSNVWTDPTAEQLQQCESMWISGPLTLRNLWTKMQSI